MLDAFAKIAEQRILEAIDNGDFNNLPGRGKPLDLSELRDVPEEMRMGYKLLKNAGVLPEELGIKKEIAVLEDLLKKCRDSDEQADLKLKLAEKNTYYNVLMEKRRRTRKKT